MIVRVIDELSVITGGQAARVAVVVFMLDVADFAARQVEQAGGLDDGLGELVVDDDGQLQIQARSLAAGVSGKCPILGRTAIRSQSAGRAWGASRRAACGHIAANIRIARESTSDVPND